MKKLIKYYFIFMISFVLLLSGIAVNLETVAAADGTSATGSTTDKSAIDSSLVSSAADTVAQLNNQYPIVMVHGLFGWGNDELFGNNYWGGTNSLKDLLTKNGFTVYTPTVGSISSNWDRACELYAYIKGGTVDYGKAHSENEGHARFGRTYEGVYPEWGTSDDSGLKKIHLIGHSMGGETIRVLAQLLENGDANEIQENSTDICPLFSGNHHWIDSITTIGTPHDGSQMDDIQENMEPFVHQLFASMAAIGGVVDSSNPCFDFRMDQWGLKQEDGESFESYENRVFSSNIWNETHDLSIWDLSLEGAKELNSWVQAQSDIYYFSIACVDTHESLVSEHQLPNINMNLLLKKSSIIMGQYMNNDIGKVQVDSSWWRNDGIVSVRSATGPHEGSSDKIISYDANSLVKGVWNYMGEISNVDHIEVVGQGNPIYQKYLQNKFIEWAQMLNSLPE